MVSASEFARLIVAFSVVPLLIRVNRRLRIKTSIRPFYTVLLVAIYLSYVLTIIEGLVAEEFMNALQHLCFGVAGVAAVLTAWYVREDVLAKRVRR